MPRPLVAWASILLILCTTLLPTTATHAGGVGLTIPPPPDSIAAMPGWFDFVRVKPDVRGTLRYRDLEVWLDGMYTNPDSGLGATQAQTNTLDRFGKVLADTVGINPFGVASTDIRLVHDYFRPDTAAAYSTNPFAPFGFRVGEPRRQLDNGDSLDVSNEDRGHIDLYVTKPHSRDAGDQGWYTAWGQYPALFRAAKEDSSTGHWYEGIPVDSLVIANSVTVAGPDAPSILWRSGIDWTAPSRNANWDFLHEFQHSLDGGGNLSRSDSFWLDEVFSSGAELLAGNTDKASSFDVDFSLSLHSPKNYPAWRLFSAYLGVNFLGRDTSPTLSGLQDDLLGRWARRQHSMATLRDLLANSECYDCSTKVYFNPPGLPPLDNAQRLRLLLHDWRVANYLNRTDIAEGRYGYRPGFDFSPFVDVRPWDNADGNAANDSSVVPPTLIITPDLAHRRLMLMTRPPRIPLNVTTYGAGYWVMRADEALAATNQDLVVRVTPETVRSTASYHADLDTCVRIDDTLMGSIIPYTQHRLASGSVDSLWKHPEWSGTPTEPVRVDVDSLAGSFEFVVRDFGGGTKACVLVLTAADGPSQGRTDFGRPSYPAGILYRLTVFLRPQGADSVEVHLLQRTAGAADDCPTWSPSGQTLAFEATITGQSSLQQIFTRPAMGGTPVALHPQALRQATPDWSPRGDLVAFEAESTSSLSSIWLKNTVSGAAVRLTPQDRRRTDPAFRPDGQRIAYAAYPAVWGSQVYEAWQIRKVEIDGTGDAALGPPLTAEPPRSLRWASDGSMIFFTRNDSLYEMSALGGPAYRNPGLLKLAGALDPHPCLDLLAIEEPGSSSGRYSCDAPNTGQITYRRIATRDTLTDDSEARFYRTGVQFFNPRWSPDGISIAFSSDDNVPGDRDLFIGRTSLDHPPAFTVAVADTTFPSFLPFTKYLIAADPDGQALSYQASFLPTGAFLAGNVLAWPNPLPGTHHVVLRVHDGAGGVQSRVVKWTVIDIPDGGGCPFVDTKTAAGWITENSVLSRALDGVPRLDAYRLKYTPQARAGRVTLRLRENEQEYTALDQVRLVAVDHDPALRAFADGERVWVGGRVPAVKAVDHHGIDMTAQVSGLAEPYQGQPGDTLYVTMTGGRVAGATGAQQVLEGGGGIIDDGDKGGEGGGGGGGNRAVPATAEQAMEAHDLAVLEGSGILIQAPDGEGGWRTVEHRYPRESFDEHVLDSLGAGELRLVFLGRHRVRFIGRLTGAEAVTPVALPLRAASHSRLGDVQGAVLAAAGGATALTPGDTLTLQYEWPEVAAGKVRDAFLLGLGTYSSSQAALRALPRDDAAVALPVAYALGQNQPNPFRGTTTIRFALPQASEVRLEVFDLQGRRVATVAEGRWVAGYHAVEWSQQASNGRRVEAGVYLYRLTAGPFRAQKKMVLVP